MKSFLAASAVAATLTIAFSLPARADCASEIQALKSTAADTAAQPGGQAAETPATAAMTAAVGQTAASPQDVQQQHEGEPTAADGAQAKMGVLLQQAEDYQKAGNEEACMKAVNEVKSISQ